jgi:hypothetical protein
MSRDVVPIFLRLGPADIALAKFLFESYEEIGVVRTLDRREAIIVVLAVADFLGPCREIVAELCRMVACQQIPAPPGAGEDWLLAELEEE